MRNGKESQQSRCVKIEPKHQWHIYSKTLDAGVFSEEHAESVNIQTSDNISVPVPELKAVNVNNNSESEGASFDSEHETYCFNCRI
jgi:hypothetical protein